MAAPQTQLSAALKFIQAASMREAELRSAGGDASADPAALLFAQTGALCDNAVVHAELLVQEAQGDEEKRIKCMLLRLLGIRLSIACTARAMALRHKARACGSLKEAHNTKTLMTDTPLPLRRVCALKPRRRCRPPASQMRRTRSRW